VKAPPRIVVRARPGVTAEKARDAHARAWAFVFECFEAKNPVAGLSVRGDDGIQEKEHPTDGRIQPAS